MIVLDTNVLSELMRPAPNPRVLAWFAVRPAAQMATTTLTQAEIFYGLNLLADGRRRTGLIAAARLVFEVDMAGRVLPFDGAAAMAYSMIAARRRRAGRPIAQIDGQIAAIASSRGGEVATRNVSDFADCGIAVLDPWTMA